MPLPPGFEPEGGMPQGFEDQTTAEIARRRVEQEKLRKNVPNVGPGFMTRVRQGMGIPMTIEEWQHIIEHPIQTLNPGSMLASGNFFDQSGNTPPTGIIGEMGDQAGKAADAFQHGEFGQGLKHAVGAGVPYLGPPMAEGNYAGALGRIIGPKVLSWAGNKFGHQTAPPIADPPKMSKWAAAKDITKIFAPARVSGTARVNAGLDLVGRIINSQKKFEPTGSRSLQAPGVNMFNSSPTNKHGMLESKGPAYINEPMDPPEEFVQPDWSAPDMATDFPFRQGYLETQGPPTHTTAPVNAPFVVDQLIRQQGLPDTWSGPVPPGATAQFGESVRPNPLVKPNTKPNNVSPVPLTGQSATSLINKFDPTDQSSRATADLPAPPMNPRELAGATGQMDQYGQMNGILDQSNNFGITPQVGFTPEQLTTLMQYIKSMNDKKAAAGGGGSEGPFDFDAAKRPSPRHGKQYPDHPPNFAEGQEPFNIPTPLELEHGPNVYAQRVRERPKGWRPIVVNRLKEFGMEDLAGPEHIALVRDAIERIADKHPHAARLLSRVELIYDPRPFNGSYLNDSLGSKVQINMGHILDKIDSGGLAGLDATLMHEITHAAQNFLRTPKDNTIPYKQRPHEISAYRRASKYVGRPDTDMHLPPKPSELKHGPELWRKVPEFVRRNVPVGAKSKKD